jgi:phosphate transport system substrate-binding protein
VKSTEGGITYVEWSYAQDNGLSMALLDNGAGRWP